MVIGCDGGGIWVVGGGIGGGVAVVGGDNVVVGVWVVIVVGGRGDG